MYVCMVVCYFFYILFACYSFYNPHNAKEDKGEEVIGLNLKSKSGNESIKTESIENVLYCNNITDNSKLRKGRNKTYADVVSDGSTEVPTKEVAFDTQNNVEVNLLKRITEKKV